MRPNNIIDIIVSVYARVEFSHAIKWLNIIIKPSDDAIYLVHSSNISCTASAIPFRFDMLYHNFWPTSCYSSGTSTIYLDSSYSMLIGSYMWSIKYTTMLMALSGTPQSTTLESLWCINVSKHTAYICYKIIYNDIEFCRSVFPLFYSQINKQFKVTVQSRFLHF